MLECVAASGAPALTTPIMLEYTFLGPSIRSFSHDRRARGRVTASGRLRPLLPRHRYPDHLVIAGSGVASPVAVARHQPQPAVRTGRDRTQPPVAAEEQPAGLRRAAGAVEPDLPQPLPSQRRHEQVAAGEGSPTRGGVGRRPGEERVHVPRRSAAALHLRPAVIGALADEVHLVEPVLAELRRVQPAAYVPGQSLHVAVPETPHRRSWGRVVCGYAAVGSQAQDP